MIQLDEHDHFNIEYEDYKNNMYFVMLNDEIEVWIRENLNSDYDLDCEDYYYYKDSSIYITFANDEDSVAFILRWI